MGHCASIKTTINSVHAVFVLVWSYNLLLSNARAFQGDPKCLDANVRQINARRRYQLAVCHRRTHRDHIHSHMRTMRQFGFSASPDPHAFGPKSRHSKPFRNMSQSQADTLEECQHCFWTPTKVEWKLNKHVEAMQNRLRLCTSRCWRWHLANIKPVKVTAGQRALTTCFVPVKEVVVYTGAIPLLLTGVKEHLVSWWQKSTEHLRWVSLFKGKPRRCVEWPKHHLNLDWF